MFSVGCQGDAVDSEIMSEYTEEEGDVVIQQASVKGFVRLDTLYLRPFFTRRITQQVRKKGTKSEIKIYKRIQ